jgi:hypothetical protein
LNLNRHPQRWLVICTLLLAGFTHAQQARVVSIENQVQAAKGGGDWELAQAELRLAVRDRILSAGAAPPFS